MEQLKFDAIRDVTQKLTVLYVEDDPITRVMNKKKLDSIFKNVILAEDGAIGLELFKKHEIDIIITDNIMPNLDGIDMIKEIRKINTKVPIIITTAYIDIDYLIAAINLNVTQFVSKPVELEMLLKAIEIAVQRVILDNLAQKTKEQELELLRYKEKYHSAQQENALKKELNLIENSFLFKKLDLINANNESNEWLIDVVYEPLEILSGDSYSIRDLGDGKVLFFIIDGMGKGLSASVTTTLSIAYTNHLLDRVIAKEIELNLKDIIQKYIQFISKMLLEEEIVSSIYALFDFVKEEVEVANFSLPPILFEKKDGTLFELKSNNMPITKYISNIKSETISIEDIDKILIYSDGLNEAFTSDGNIYGEFLVQDFKETLFMKNLLNRFKQKVPKKDDDLTVFHIFRMPKEKLFSKEFVINTNLNEIDRLSNEIEPYLKSLNLVQDFIVPYMTTFTELIMNAYEHGNLGISNSLKRKLIKSSEYDDYIVFKEQECDKKIYIRVDLLTKMGQKFLATYITDEGNGFDTKILEKLLVGNMENFTENGRGILMSKGFSDELLYNKNANSVLFINLI